MKQAKNIIATVLICAVASTVGFAAAKAPLWTLNGKTVQTKTDKNGTWVLVPKNFEIGTLINESNRKLKLTEDNFTKANKVGNTYEAVCKILGGKGILYSKRLKNDSKGDNRTIEIYDWKDSQVTVTLKFINGKVDDSTLNEWHFQE